MVSNTDDRSATDQRLPADHLTMVCHGRRLMADRSPTIADRSPTIANYHRPPYNFEAVTLIFGQQPVVRPVANQNECDCNIFFVTKVTDGRRWLQVVAEDFGQKWSPTGRRLSVTGPLAKTLELKIIVHSICNNRTAT